MKWIVIIGGGLIALLLALVLIVPSLVPSETYQSAIQDQLSRELDREVRIEGDVSLSTFPVVRAKSGRATIANPPGYSRGLMASIEGLEARIKLWPLLSRRVEIASFTLVEPDILLERRADGSANWIVDAYQEAEAPASEPEGPFRRDGRYENIDPRLAIMRIENGRLTYNDIPADRRVDLSNVNIDLAMPSLSDEMVLDGSFDMDGQAITTDLALDSPRAFLDGQAASIRGLIETEAGRIELDGAFPASERIAFVGDVSGDILDISFLQRFLPEPVPALSLVERVTFEASAESDGNTTLFEQLKANVTGETLSVSYDGTARYNGTISTTGRYNLDATDISTIAASLAPDLEGLETIEALSSTGRVSMNGDNMVVSDLVLNVSGPGLVASATGQMSRTAGALGGMMQFDAEAADAATLARSFAPDLTRDANVIGAAEATGTLTLSGETISVSNLSVSTESEVLASNYNGSVVLEDETIRLDGKITATVPSVSALDQSVASALPYAYTIGRAEVSVRLSGPATELTLNDMVARLSDGALNGSYTGRAIISNVSELDGKLDVSTNALRRIANEAGAMLPASTAAGDIFENFALRGDVSGPVDDIELTDATIVFDQLSGTGRFGINMKGETPKLTGQLVMEAVDLQPYMQAYSAARPEGTVQSWSEEPLPVDSFSSVDADIELSAPSIILPQLTLGRTRANIVLSDGRLLTDIPEMALYGGSGSGQLVFDAKSANPTFSLDADLDALQASTFLSDVAGFTQVEGTGKTAVALRGSGSSQAAIIRSLSGSGEFTLSDGLVKGIDAGEFMSGLQRALTSRSLPGGIGADKTTEYRFINGRFDMAGGVASVDQFSLTAAEVAVMGSGQVDLGGQMIDFRLRPRAVGRQANSLASFGIPIRLRGPFNAVKPQLDSEFLGEIIQAQAANEAQKLVTNALGGNGDGSSTGGGLLGSILGTEPTTSEPDDIGSETAKPENKDAEEKKSPEDVLLELFGVKER